MRRLSGCETPNVPSLGGEPGCYLVEVCEDAELGAHLWYGVLELLNPPLLLCFLFLCHCPLTLNQAGYYHRVARHITHSSLIIQ